MKGEKAIWKQNQENVPFQGTFILWDGWKRNSLSNFVTSMCGDNAKAALDKCFYMHVLIKHSVHLKNE